MLEVRRETKVARPEMSEFGSFVESFFEVAPGSKTNWLAIGAPMLIRDPEIGRFSSLPFEALASPAGLFFELAQGLGAVLHGAGRKNDSIIAC